MSRNVKSLRFYLAAEPASVSQIVSGHRRLRSQRQRTLFSQHSRQHVHMVLIAPQIPQGDVKISSGGCCTREKLRSQGRNVELKTLPSCKAPVSSQVTFALEGNIINMILDSKNLCFSPWKEIVSLSSKAVCCTNSLEKMGWNKS